MAKRILVADDSITIQKVVELALSDAYEVKCVGNGALAIEQAEQYRPDVILCDALMPERDGYEVCAFVKEHPELRKIPVLILHGAFESFDEGRARALGANDTLVKPFDTQALLDKVAALLAAPPPPDLDAVPAEESAPSALAGPQEEDISRVMSRVDDAFEAFSPKIEEQPEAQPAPPPAPLSEAQLAPESPQERTVAISAADVAKMLGTVSPPETEAKPADPGKTAAVTDLDRELAKMDFGGDEESMPIVAGRKGEEKPASPSLPSEPAKKAMPTFDVSASSIISVSEMRDERIAGGGQHTAGDAPADDIPVAYYEPPQGMTEEDKAYAREMMASSSVPMDDVLPEGVKPSAPFAGADAPSAPVVREEERVPAPDTEDEEEDAAMPKEDMNTTELLRDVGGAPVSTAQALLSEKDIEEIVERAVKRVSEKLIREIAWEVVPDLAEVLIRKKIEEIEKGVKSGG